MDHAKIAWFPIATSVQSIAQINAISVIKTIFTINLLKNVMLHIAQSPKYGMEVTVSAALIMITKTKKVYAEYKIKG